MACPGLSDESRLMKAGILMRNCRGVPCRGSGLPRHGPPLSRLAGPSRSRLPVFRRAALRLACPFSPAIGRHPCRDLRVEHPGQTAGRWPGKRVPGRLGQGSPVGWGGGRPRPCRPAGGERRCRPAAWAGTGGRERVTYPRPITRQAMSNGVRRPSQRSRPADTAEDVIRRPRDAR